MIVKFSSFWAYIGNEPPEILSEVKRLLTYETYDNQTRITKKHKLYVADPILDYETIRIPHGLVEHVAKTLHLEVDDRSLHYMERHKGTLLNLCEDIKKNNPNFQTRDYQIEAVMESTRRFASLINYSTGSGKTSIMALLVKFLSDERFLICNNNQFILDQIYERLLMVGVREDEISYTTSSKYQVKQEPKYGRRIILITTQTLANRLQDTYEVRQAIQQVNTIIWDEAQHVQASQFFIPIFYTNYVNLRHLVGYSGSPYRDPKFPYKNPDDALSIGILGEPAISYTMKMGIEDGALAQPHSYFINYKDHPIHPPKGFEKDWFMLYRLGIVYNKTRNTAGIAMMKYLHEHGIKTLALFNEIKAHGLKIMLAMKEIGIPGIFVAGQDTVYEYSNEVDKKTKKLKLIKTKGGTEKIEEAFNKGYKLIFASTKLNEGVDLPDVEAAVLWAGGKSIVSLTQRAGRTVRKKTTTNNTSFIIDFNDNQSHFIHIMHANQRRNDLYGMGAIPINTATEIMQLIDTYKVG